MLEWLNPNVAMGVNSGGTLHLLFNHCNMADKGGAYGTKSGDTDFRKKWDKEEYAEKARKKDEEEKDRMKENEARMKQGRSIRSVSWNINANISAL